jgi:hypothetical protein
VELRPGFLLWLSACGFYKNLPTLLGDLADLMEGRRAGAAS